ncbi:MAG: PH domain-containing protein, partial [Cyclobacteriaceae bacterium]
GPLNRLFKLTTLKIYTAGGSTSDLNIPGLEYDDAQKLREYIAEKSSKHD